MKKAVIIIGILIVILIVGLLYAEQGKNKDYETNKVMDDDITSTETTHQKNSETENSTEETVSVNESKSTPTVDTISSGKVQTDKYTDINTVEELWSDYGKTTYKMNLEVPVGDGPFPVVIYIHGGGWTTDVTKGMTDIMFGNTKQALLNNGFAFATATYTLSKEDKAGANPTSGSITSGYPQMIYDLKAVVRALRSNAETYKLDKDFIAVMGDSAGGHLSALMGTTNGNSNYEDLEMGFSNYSSDVQAVISYYGPMYFDYDSHEYIYVNSTNELTDYNMTWKDQAAYMDTLLCYALLGYEDDYDHKLRIDASPLHQLTTEAPPMFFLYGALDPLINVDHNRLMIDKYKELVGEDTLQVKYFEDAIHGDLKDNVRTYDSPEAATEVVSFLKKLY